MNVEYKRVVSADTIIIIIFFLFFTWCGMKYKKLIFHLVDALRHCIHFISSRLPKYYNVIRLMTFLVAQVLFGTFVDQKTSRNVL